MKHRRAIGELEKEERRQQILAAAAGLIDSSSFELVSIQDVALACGIAKGTVYLYFSTKEELFLALLEAEFTNWFEALRHRLTAVAELAGLAGRERIGFFAQALTSSLAASPRLLRLLPILHPILERNLSYPAALEFKRRLLKNLQDSGAALEAVVDFLRPGQGTEIILSAYAQLIGLQSMAGASPMVQKILEEPEMALFQLDVMDALARVVTHLLQGYALDVENKGYL